MDYPSTIHFESLNKLKGDLRGKVAIVTGPSKGIVNIASIAGLTGVEQMSGYCATKFAVRGISQALYKEVRDYGVKVTCIYPGSVDTHFFDLFANVTQRENMMQPEDIASTILHVLASPPNYHHVDIEVRPLQPKGKRKG
ncbi:hypothetical protein BH24BAC1_BH24BAC1_07060 [soil metagenome]